MADPGWRHRPAELPKSKRDPKPVWCGFCGSLDAPWPCDAEQMRLRTEAAEADWRKALIDWKLLDQPDKPRAVVEKWADWYIETEVRAPSLEGARHPEAGEPPHPYTCAYCRDDGIIGPGSEWPRRALFEEHMAVVHPGLPYDKPLAASPGARHDVPGLDVERLARAWHNVMTRDGAGTFVRRADWREVAAEYARLAE